MKYLSLFPDGMAHYVLMGPQPECQEPIHTKA